MPCILAHTAPMSEGGKPTYPSSWRYMPLVISASTADSGCCFHDENHGRSVGTQGDSYGNSPQFYNRDVYLWPDLKFKMCQRKLEIWVCPRKDIYEQCPISWESGCRGICSENASKLTALANNHVQSCISAWNEGILKASTTQLDAVDDMVADGLWYLALHTPVTAIHHSESWSLQIISRQKDFPRYYLSSL